MLNWFQSHYMSLTDQDEGASASPAIYNNIILTQLIHSTVYYCAVIGLFIKCVRTVTQC